MIFDIEMIKDAEQKRICELLNEAEALAIECEGHVKLTWTFSSGAKIELEAGTKRKRRGGKNE